MMGQLVNSNQNIFKVSLIGVTTITSVRNLRYCSDIIIKLR